MMPTALALPADCTGVVRALWAYLDRALDDADMAAIDDHLAICEDCRGHATFERRLIEAIRALRSRHPEPSLLRTRVLDLLRQARFDTRVR